MSSAEITAVCACSMSRSGVYPRQEGCGSDFVADDCALSFGLAVRRPTGDTLIESEEPGVLPAVARDTP